jgi:DNA-binding response OmpR family regulator
MNKIIKVAFLDDEQSQLDVMKFQVDSFNRHSKDRIKLSCYTSPNDLIKNFNHDLALIDISLGKVDGFDIAKIIMKKYHKPVIMTSNSIPNSEVLESLISKVGLRISEIMNRFNILKRNSTKNALQIFSRRDAYHAPTLAG